MDALDAWLTEPVACWGCGEVCVSRYCLLLGDPYCTSDCEYAAWFADAIAMLRALTESD